MPPLPMRMRVELVKRMRQEPDKERRRQLAREIDDDDAERQRVARSGHLAREDQT